MDYPHRPMAELPDISWVAALLDVLNRRVITGKTAFRQYVAVSTYTFAMTINGRIPTDLSWHGDLAYKQAHPIARFFEGMWERGAVDRMRYGAETLERALMEAIHNEGPFMYLNLKALEMSDTPNWFVPSEALAYSLMGTDLDGVLTEDVKLPAPGLYIEVPPGFFESRTDRGYHKVLAIGVTTSVVPTNTKLAASSVSPLSSVSHYVDIGDVVQSRDRLCITLIQEPLAGDRDMTDCSTYSFNVPMRPGAEIAEMLKAEHVAVNERRSPEARAHFKSSWGKVFGKDVSHPELNLAALKYVVNVLVYLTTENCQKTERRRKPPKGKKARSDVARGKALMRSRDWVLGTDVKLSSGVRAHIMGESPVKRRKPTDPVFVRGHYRQQAHGPKWSLRRKTWIDPHLRYDNGGPVRGHNYR